MAKTQLSQSTPEQGYISAATRGQGGNWMRPPSANVMMTGQGFVRAFRGVNAQSGKQGSRVFFNTDQTYAGLGTASVNGSGSVFYLRRLLAYIGAGALTYDGVPISGINASSTLSFIKKSGGSYAPGTLTGPFQAGHAQSSAPTIYAKTSPSAGKITINGVITVVIWRVSSITGQVSLASLPSNELSLTNQTAIVQFPLPDTNGQDIWGIGVPKIGFVDLGVFYELPINLKGEVLESELSYTRAVASASVANGATVVDAAAGAFTSADIGRRISFGAFNSWITAINSATQVQVADASGSAVTGAATITHAIDGITRAVEIGWSNGALKGQNIAPDKAFPPPAGQFAGALNDVLWLESDGIIYVGEPNQSGSFPPSNSLFPNEAALNYLRGSDGGYWRIGKQSLGVLFYVGGSPALEYQEISSTLGILYPQNAAIGAGGRLMLWQGKPVVMTGLDPDTAFDEAAERVAPDFAGWEAQTADAPVVPGYDPVGKYEVWCRERKVMAYHVPSGKWCAPLNLTSLVAGNIVATVTYQQKLFLSCINGATLTLYQFDVGSGSVMVMQMDDARGGGYGDTITEVLVQGRTDNTTTNVRVEVVRNFQDATPILISNKVATTTGTQHFPPILPCILNAKDHAVRVTLTSQGGDVGVDMVEVSGEVSGVVTL